MKTARNFPYLVLILAALTSVTPLSIDMYLPSMPQIASSMSVGIEKIEMTVSIFLLFFALGQMIGGALSDRIGRRKTALSGLIGFIVADFALFYTASLEQLYLFRALQAFFGGLAIVNSAAVVRDLFHGTEAAKFFSAIASVTMIAPMIAPALGALVIAHYPWNTIFLFLGIYASAVAIALFFRMPETGTRTRNPVLSAYRRILTHRQALGYILTLSFAFSGMFVFIEKSSFIYMEYFAQSRSVFPIFFGANVVVMILMTRLNIRLLQNYSASSLLRTGVVIQFTASLLLVGIAKHASLSEVFILLMLYVGILGIIFGNGMALALEHFKHDSGVANSVIGVTEFTIAGAIGFFASTLHTGELFSVFTTMSVTAGLSLFSFFFIVRSGKVAEP